MLLVSYSVIHDAAVLMVIVLLDRSLSCEEGSRYHILRLNVFAARTQQWGPTALARKVI